MTLRARSVISHRKKSYHLFAMMIIAQLASDDVLDRAYEWLCRRRRDYSANSDIWNFRRGWLLEKQARRRQVRPFMSVRACSSGVGETEI